MEPLLTGVAPQVCVVNVTLPGLNPIAGTRTVTVARVATTTDRPGTDTTGDPVMMMTRIAQK